MLGPPLRLDELAIQVVHGPLLPDGSFDQRHLHVVPMTIGTDGRFHAAFAPDQAGRWGVTVRAMPSHPQLSGPYDTGLVATG